MAPGVPVIDLFADAPAGNPRSSAYLLAAYVVWFPERTVFLCVVDPGVGGARPALFLEADGRWYVGPGNGLFELVQRRARETRCFEIEWRPKRLSASFHGRDLFAPFAAMLARGDAPPGRPCEDAGRCADWPDDLSEIVLRRSLRQRDDGLKGGGAAARRKAVGGRTRVGAREDFRRSAAGRRVLVREFERACRNRRQSGACGPRSRSFNRHVR